MVISSEQFVIGMKLRELRKQRQKLLETYNQLDQQLADSSTEAASLELLYNGLRQIKFAGHALHPDVINLEPILQSLPDQSVEPNPSTVEKSSQENLFSADEGNNAPSFWRLQLEKELVSGRQRSEIVYIFAALLEEWTGSEKEDTDQEVNQRRASLLEIVVNPAITNPILDHQFLDNLFTQFGFGTAEATEQLQGLIRQYLPTSIEFDELRKTLRKISRDQYHSATTRRQAQDLQLNHMLLKEFADALTLMLNELVDWNWPTEGISMRAALTPNKWRLFLNEDLPTACLLEILGRRWQESLEDFFNQTYELHLQEWRRNSSGLAPAARLDGALKLYRQAFGIFPSPYSEVDIWTSRDVVVEDDIWEDPSRVEARVKNKISLEELLERWAKSDSIQGKRASLKSWYRDLGRIDEYASVATNDDMSEIEQALAQINAEIKIGQVAFPGKPIYILKADFKDYYPSLSHELVLEVLTRLGLNQSQIEFFRRYLQVSVKPEQNQPEAGVAIIQRGVPNHRRLSDLLGELVLLMLDFYIAQSARVQSIRLIDDICLIATDEEEARKAWQALEKFCTAFGLTLNEGKSGAVCIGGSLPVGLPTTLPVWSMVTLNEQGEWQVDEARFEEFLTQTRQQVNQTNSVIAKVEVYNNGLNYLVKALALRVRLDESHRQSVNKVMRRFQNDFFSPGVGMVAQLRLLISQRFLEQGSTAQLPDGWLHWPITAGGLSLSHPLVLTNSYARNFKRDNSTQGEVELPEIAQSLSRRMQVKASKTVADEVAIPQERLSDWQRRTTAWYSYYRQFLEVVPPAEPERNAVMETLVVDFIARGAEISMGEQEGLSAYWRWIVYLYGAQIRQQLGTFRFLITELVPAQLITGKYRQGFLEPMSADTGDTDWLDMTF